MSDFNVNLSKNVEQLNKFLKEIGDGKKDLTAEDVQSVFSELQEGEENVNFFDFAVGLTENFTDENVNSYGKDYVDALAEISALDGEAYSFSQKDIDLLLQALNDTPAPTDPTDDTGVTNPTDTPAPTNPTDDTGVTNPTDTPAPTNPTDDTGVTNPTDTPAPTDPTDDTGVTNPTDTPAPTDPTDDTGVTNPTDTPAPTDPTDDTGVTNPTDTPAPTDSTEKPDVGGEEPDPDLEVTLSESEIEAYADQLFEAMDGWGTDEHGVNTVLYNNSLTSADLVSIMDAYEAKYGETLKDAIKDDYSWMSGEKDLLGILEDAEKAVEEGKKKEEDDKAVGSEPVELPTTLTDREVGLMADKLYNAMKNLGTDEDAVNSILNDGSLTPADIVNIKNAYEEKYDKTLESDIKGDFSGKAEDDLLKVLSNADKEVEKAVLEQSKQDVSLSDREIDLMVDKLHTAMKGWGTDEQAVNEVLNDESLTAADILTIMNAYEEKYGESLESDIKGDFSGDAEDGLLEVLTNAEKEVMENVKTDPVDGGVTGEVHSYTNTLNEREVDLIVDKLYSAMKDLGTDEEAINEVLNDESLTAADIVTIMNAYEAKYGKTLESDIKGDFSSEAQDSLLGVLDKAKTEMRKNIIEHGESTLSDREVELMADNLRLAMKGAGTEEEAVSNILNDPSLTAADILKIMDKFEEKYGESLEDDIKGDFSGEAQKSLLGVLKKAETDFSCIPQDAETQTPADDGAENPATLDANGDGKVSEHEMINYIAEKAGDYSLDINNDKDISFDEAYKDQSFQAVMHDLTEAEAKEYEDAGFKVHYNDDGSASVNSQTKVEFEYDHVDLTADLDSNQDGVITEEDFIVEE